ENLRKDCIVDLGSFGAWRDAFPSLRSSPACGGRSLMGFCWSRCLVCQRVFVRAALAAWAPRRPTGTELSFLEHGRLSRIGDIVGRRRYVAVGLLEEDRRTGRFAEWPLGLVTTLCPLRQGINDATVRLAAVTQSKIPSGGKMGVVGPVQYERDTS